MITRQAIGLTLNHLVAWSPPTPWPTDFAVSYIRAWGTYVTWNKIETSKGVYDWAGFDALLAMCAQHGTKILFCLADAPAWARLRPADDYASPPANVSDYTDFIAAVIKRDPGRIIDAFEVWNEPMSRQFWTGTNDQLLALQKAAYTSIKALDHARIVTTPGIGGFSGISYADPLFAAGLCAYADVVAIHGYTYYPNLGPNPPQYVEQLKPIFASWVALMKKYGIVKSIWDTESAFYVPGITDPKLQAEFCLKSCIMHVFSGIARFYWYSYESRDYGCLRSAAGGLTPAGIAYRTALKWLIGNAVASSLRQVGTQWSCNLTGPDGLQAEIIWDTAGGIFAVPAIYSLYFDIGMQSFPVPPSRQINVGSSPLMFVNMAPAPASSRATMGM